ncbi:MAG TPA: carboxypeptidase-like regulatory domain-containing protein [Terriglobia bacterium]|nr:carboxypeptidase-like regulatory domain-containing protein [Terriglobia bacterium]
MKTLAFAFIFLFQAAAPRGQGGAVTGTVLNPDGSPAAGVRVVAISASLDGVAGAVMASLAQTDAAGAYRLEDIPPGSYVIAAGALDWLAYYPGVRDRAGAQVVVVASGEIRTGVDFVWFPPPMLAGYVELEGGGVLPTRPVTTPGSGAPSLLRLSVRTLDRTTVLSPFTTRSEPGFEVQGNGRFKLLLTPGTYRLDFATVPIGFEVESMTYGDRNLLNEPVDVKAENSGSGPEIRIRLKRVAGVRVSGRIVGLPSGAPLPSGVILESVAPGRMREATQVRIGAAPVSPDGTFEFADVSWGTYTVRSVSAAGQGSAVDVAVTDRDVSGVDVPGALQTNSGPALRTWLESLQGNSTPIPRDIPPRPPTIPAIP